MYGTCGRIDDKADFDFDLSLLFTSRYTMEAFLIFLYYYYLIPQCLLNILLCISRYNTACDVSYAMPRLIRFC